MSGHQYRMAFLTTASSMLMAARAQVRQLCSAPQVPTSMVPALTRAACTRACASRPSSHHIPETHDSAEMAAGEHILRSSV